MEVLSIIFSLKDEKGALRKALKVFDDLDISLSHIESRPSKTNPGAEYDFYVKCVCSEVKRLELVDRLIGHVTSVRVLQEDSSSLTCQTDSSPSKDNIPWFPKSIKDLHRCCANLFKYGHELTPDHPGFGDAAYVERRKHIAKVAKEYT